MTNPQLYGPVRPDVRKFLTKVAIHEDECVLDDTKYQSGKGNSKGNYKKLDPKPELECWLVRPLIEVLNVLYNQIAVITLGEDILNLADDSNMMIFAAAGNDGNPNKQPKHPPAMYPAAYRPVHGVGALDKSNKASQTARYSNIADSPVSDGFLTFGGFPSDIGVGMLGLYIHPTFPDGGTGIPNTNGWARWSGTSFATGVMSGLAAALLCHCSPREVLELFYGLPDTGFGEPHEVDVEQS